MSVRRIEVRGIEVSVDQIQVRSGGKTYPYLRARLPLGVDPYTHRARPAKVITAKTEDELRKKVVKAMDARLGMGGITASQVTVREWCNYYLEHYLEGSLSTQRSMRLACKNHIVPYFGSMYLQELLETQVEDFRDHLLVQKGLSPSTVGNILSALNVMLDRAVHNRLIAINPASMVRKPRRTHVQKVILTKEQTRDFMQELEHDRYGNLIGLLITTGFRIGEGLGLAEDRVDFARRRVAINQHVIVTELGGKTRTILAASTKTGVDRTISVPRQSMEFIEAELADRKARSARAGAAWNNPHDLIYVGNKGGYLHYPTIERHVRMLGEKVGRPDLTPHTLRHTAATILYLRSHNIIWVRDMLGHLNLATTERYIHVTTEDLLTIPYGHSRDMQRINKAEVPVDLDFESLEF